MEPQRTSWFGGSEGSEVARIPVQPELGAGNTRAARLALPATAKRVLARKGEGPGHPWQGFDTGELETMTSDPRQDLV